MNVVYITILITTAFAYDPLYGFEIQTYNTSFNIKSDYSMHVIEDIEIKYLGLFSTGIVRDIPLEYSDYIKHVDVKLKEGDKLLNYPYDVKLEASFLQGGKLYLIITDHIRKQNQTQVLHISYDFFIAAPRNENAIYLNVIGFGWNANIKHANVFLQLPNSYNKSDFFIGNTNTPSNDKYIYDKTKRTIVASVNNLSCYNGLTFNLYFNNRTLSIFHDSTPLFIALFYAIILLILFVIQYLYFKRKKINPIMNLNISKYMDPLFMCRVIDNYVNSNDITSLIYFWASESYISITYIGKEDCLFKKLCSELPINVPMYQKVMFNNLFQNGDEVKVSSLNNYFYSTINKVVIDVNETKIQKYNKKSINVSYLYQTIGCLIMGLLPYIICKLNISSKISYLDGLYIFIPTNIIWLYSMNCFSIEKDSISINSETQLWIANCLIITALCYSFHIPNTIIDYMSKFVMCLFWFINIELSFLVVNPTDKYIQLLNQIIGLKEFINNIAKKDLEVLLKNHPQLFYNILPYAQVLNMNEIWENKFDGLDIVQPKCLIIPENTYFEPVNYDFNYDEQSFTYNYYFWRSFINDSRNSMNQCFNSLPPPQICSWKNRYNDSSDDYNVYGGVSCGGGEFNDGGGFSGGIGGGGHCGGGGYGI